MDVGLQGKVALVTGATRGIGRAIAEALGREGCALAICARSEDEFFGAVAALEREHGVAVFGAAVDVTDAAALARFVDDAAATLGGLDVAVANAGGSSGAPGLADSTTDDWVATYALNAGHAVTLFRASVPHLRARGGGALLVVSSISGSRPSPRAQYGAAKAAEHALAASLARELGADGIRVVSLSPGSILFPGGGWEATRERDSERFAGWVERAFPFGRRGRPRRSPTSRPSSPARGRRGSAGPTSSSTARRARRRSPATDPRRPRDARTARRAHRRTSAALPRSDHWPTFGAVGRRGGRGAGGVRRRRGRPG